MKSAVLCAALAVVAGGFIAQTAHADSADATCEVRKNGDKQKGKSGPCTFSQRQGYIDIDLKNGDTIRLSPAGGTFKYRDQGGAKVTRTVMGQTEEYRWEGGKTLTLRYTSSGGGYAAPAAVGASGLSTQRENAEWQRGYNDGLAGRYDQDSHTQPYKDGVAAGEAEARNRGNGGGGGGGGGGHGYAINELDDGAFEIMWKNKDCFASFDRRGRSIRYSPGCTDDLIRRSNDIARDRTN